MTVYFLSDQGRGICLRGGYASAEIRPGPAGVDFIKYSLEDESIRYFISKLNCLEGIRIEIKGNKIIKAFDKSLFVIK